MEANSPVWAYYPKDDSYFVDSIYVTGQADTYMESTKTPPAEKGLDFQLVYPSDPCPEGWAKGQGGWCITTEPEFGFNGLYSEESFVPKYQYWEGYAPRLSNPMCKQVDHFDQHSVSLWSGDYVVFNNPHPASNRGVYGHLPLKDSYLA